MYPLSETLFHRLSWFNYNMMQVQLDCHNVLQASNDVATTGDEVRETHKEYIIFYFIQKLRF